jgi:spore maturation protein CgeB
MRIALADDAALIYSDNWRHGWAAGFRALGCQVSTVDVSSLRSFGSSGGPYSTRGATRGKILAQQILAEKPDLVWCYHGRAASASSFLDVIRRAGVPTALFLPDEPYEVGESARFSPAFDFVFTLDHCTVEAHLRSRPLARQADVFYLPPCADTDRFKPPPHGATRTTSALFLGNPMLVPRETWLRAVEKAIPGTRILSWPVKGRPSAKGAANWIPDSQHPELYASCQVGLNIHRDPRITRECYKRRVLGRLASMSVPSGLKLWDRMPADDGTGFWNDANLPAAHVNPRFFEMAACGTLVVNDNHRTELVRMFPGAPRADTAEQFVQLVHHCLQNPEETAELGRQCASLISKRHTYRHRAAEVLIRTGCKALVPDDRLSSLGEPAEWITPQDLPLPAVTSSSVPTGR